MIRWQFDIELRRVWFAWTWQVTLTRQGSVLEVRSGHTTSRRRALKQAHFWIRVALRKFDIDDHAWVQIKRRRR